VIQIVARGYPPCPGNRQSRKTLFSGPRWAATAAAGRQAEASKPHSQKAASAAANETRNARQFTKTRASAIQAHSRARGQRRPAKRNSR